MTDAAELRKLLEELSAHPADETSTARMEALAELGWQVRMEDWREGEQLSKEAYELAVKAGHVPTRAKAARTLSMFRRWRNDLAGALELGLKALADFRELGDRVGCAAVLDATATIFEDLGDYPTALEYARDAYDTGVELEDVSRQGWALSSLGGIHAASGDHEEAIRILERALKLFDEASSPLGMAKVAYRLGKVLLDTGDIEAARARYTWLFKLSETHFNRRFGYGGLGDVARAEGDFVEARRLYMEAEHHLTGLGVRPMLLDVQLSLVRLCIDEGDLDEARRRVSAMLAEAEQMGAKPLLAQTHELLSEICQRDGDAGAAMHHYKRFNELHRQVLSDETRAIILHERSRREIESAQKDAEIHRLRFVELANMQAKLLESEKLAALGHLAAGIAHELNTPLGVLQSNLDLSRVALARLQDVLGDDVHPRAKKSLRAIASVGDTSASAVQRVAQFVRSVTQFSGVDDATEQLTDLRACAASVLDMMAPNFPPEVVVVRRLQDVPLVWAHPARVNQALVTLTMRAADAMKDGGELTVELGLDNGHVVARVGDTGPGIAQGELANIFEVAFADDGERVQMSLGLPTVAATMNALGGSVSADSEIGAGTTITLRFPVPA